MTGLFPLRSSAGAKNSAGEEVGPIALEEGSLSPVIGRQSDLGDGPKLFEAKELGRARGKVSITVSSDAS